MRQELPTGKVTFLFTEYEGSTGLLEEDRCTALRRALGAA